MSDLTPPSPSIASTNAPSELTTTSNPVASSSTSQNVPAPSDPSPSKRQALVTKAEQTSVYDILLFLIGFRIVNALVVRTFFQPDEYFQALEPAWKLVFGEDSGAWITWVCSLQRALLTKRLTIDEGMEIRPTVFALPIPSCHPIPTRAPHLFSLLRSRAPLTLSCPMAHTKHSLPLVAPPVCAPSLSSADSGPH